MRIPLPLNSCCLSNLACDTTHRELKQNVLLSAGGSAARGVVADRVRDEPFRARDLLRNGDRHEKRRSQRVSEPDSPVHLPQACVSSCTRARRPFAGRRLTDVPVRHRIARHPSLCDSARDRSCITVKHGCHEEERIALVTAAWHTTWRAAVHC